MDFNESQAYYTVYVFAGATILIKHSSPISFILEEFAKSKHQKLGQVSRAVKLKSQVWATLIDFLFVSRNSGGNTYPAYSDKLCLWTV